MKIGVIINPLAGSSEQSEALRRVVARRDDVFVVELGRDPSMEKAVALALEEDCGIIAAAGGDGTVNQLLNALVSADTDATMGVIPLGTGNDFARTLSMGVDVRDAIAQLALRRVERLDLMRVSCGGEGMYGINAAAGGFSGKVDEAMSAELKATYGPLAYVIAAVSSLPNLEGYSLTVGLDGGSPEALDAIAVVVANGRTIGGGKLIAPIANPQDGLLEVIIIKSSTMLAVADVGTRLVSGSLLGSRHVMHRQARSIRIEAEPGMIFNVDGELLNDSVVEIDVEPSRINVAVGAGYHAEPVPSPSTG